MKLKAGCTGCFKNLSVKSRSEIFKFLQESKKPTVNNIVLKIGLTQPTVSYHLKEMEKSGLLKSQKKGREVFYEINKQCPADSEKCILIG